MNCNFGHCKKQASVTIEHLNDIGKTTEKRNMCARHANFSVNLSPSHTRLISVRPLGSESEMERARR